MTNEVFNARLTMSAHKGYVEFDNTWPLNECLNYSDQVVYAETRHNINFWRYRDELLKTHS